VGPHFYAGLLNGVLRRVVVKHNAQRHTVPLIRVAFNQVGKVAKGFALHRS
jgi:hypothetical protein